MPLRSQLSLRRKGCMRVNDQRRFYASSVLHSESAQLRGQYFRRMPTVDLRDILIDLYFKICLRVVYEMFKISL